MSCKILNLTANKNIKFREFEDSYFDALVALAFSFHCPLTFSMRPLMRIGRQYLADCTRTVHNSVTPWSVLSEVHWRLQRHRSSSFSAIVVFFRFVDTRVFNTYLCKCFYLTKSGKISRRNILFGLIMMFETCLYSFCFQDYF